MASRTTMTLAVPTFSKFRSRFRGTSSAGKRSPMSPMNTGRSSAMIDHKEACSSWLGWCWLPATPQEAEIPLKLRAAFISHWDREANWLALPRRHFQKSGL